MRAFLPFALALAASPARAFDLKPSSLPLERAEGCVPRAFTPDWGMAVHLCGAELVVFDLASGKRVRSMPAAFIDAQVVVTPDGERAGILANTERERWDLAVFGLETGQELRHEKDFGEAGSREEVEKLWKKALKSEDLKGARTFAAPGPDLTAATGLRVHLRFVEGKSCVQLYKGGFMLVNELWPGPRPFEQAFTLKPEAAAKLEGEDLAELMKDREFVEILRKRGDLITAKRRGPCEYFMMAEDGLRVLAGKFVYRVDADPALIDRAVLTKRAELKLSHGYNLAGLEEWNEAVVRFTEALELDPDLPRAHLLRGIMRLKLEDSDGAISDIEAAAKADRSAAKELGELLARARESKRLAAALKRNPKDAQALRQRGVFRFTLTRYRDCEEDLSAAEKLGAALSPQELELRGSCAQEVAAASERYRRAAQARADEELAKHPLVIEPAGSWVTSVDLAGISRAIVAGSRSVGNSGSSPSYSPAPSRTTSSSGGGSYPAAAPVRGPDYNAIVNRRVEQKLWDMNNPFR